MKNIPGEMWMGAHQIKISPTTKEKFTEMYPGDQDGENTIGEYDHVNNAIRLLSTLIGTRKAVTFVHEIIEAINWQNDLGMNHTQISMLSESLTAVLTVNKIDLNKVRLET
jgi:hypothetical protein